jgi:hypothetical protein
MFPDAGHMFMVSVNDEVILLVQFMRNHPVHRGWREEDILWEVGGGGELEDVNKCFRASFSCFRSA